MPRAKFSQLTMHMDGWQFILGSVVILYSMTYITTLPYSVVVVIPCTMRLYRTRTSRTRTTHAGASCGAAPQPTRALNRYAAQAERSHDARISRGGRRWNASYNGAAAPRKTAATTRWHQRSWRHSSSKASMKAWQQTTRSGSSSQQQRIIK